jgi:ketosteroid isomerase-like protein
MGFNNNGDAAAVAACFTEDAVLVTDTGPIYGREAIEKYHADQFKQFHFSDHLNERDQYSPHIIGTAGNEVWKNGEWSTTLQGKDFGPIQLKGYWSSITVRDGDTWKDRLQTFNITPAPPATDAASPTPTSTPSKQ